MLVSEQTFQKLCADAIQNTAWPGVNIVSLPSLLALKCHAVKHGRPGRIVKDADDVIRLMQGNQLDPKSPEQREIFETIEQNNPEKCCEPAPRIEPAELEFPDWSGMDDSPGRITPEAALRLSSIYPKLAAAARGGKPERSQPSPVEFVL